MPYLRPTALHPQKPLGQEHSIDSPILTQNISKNMEKCPIAQYIINELGIKDFVKKGNKTKLGIHIEKCGICSPREIASAPIFDPSETSAMYDITDFAIKRLRAVHRSIDPGDISQLILSALADAEMKEEMYSKWQKEIADITKKYEDLKAIKKASIKAILFPHQKQEERQKQDMQSKKVKYLEELLKRDELEIARLKDLITLQEKGSK